MSTLSGEERISGELTPEQAISATLQAAGSVSGSLSTGLSYDMLRNLPKLNGLTIEGDKTSFYYSVPTIKFDTKEHWDGSFEISEKNVIYVYTDYSTDEHGVNIAALKIGDGTSYIVDLPFIGVDESLIRDHIENTEIHITATEREFWNNKNRSYAHGETLVLTNL